MTQDGRALEIDPSETCPEDAAGLHLYRETAPLPPLVVSTLRPRQFYGLIGRAPTSLLVLPAVFLAEQLDQLADYPESGTVDSLPDASVDHHGSAL